MPTFETATTIPSPTLSKEVALSTPLQLEDAMGKRNKKAIGKKVGRRVGSSESHDSPLLVDIDPLPHGVLIRPQIRSLKKEIHRLKKKLRKIEDDLQESRKNASKKTIKVTHLKNLHRKDSSNFSIQKDSFEKEMAKMKRSASNKSWKLTSKIRSLEIDLMVMKKKFQLLEETSSWSTERIRYD
ncbi:hypothetical protein COCNU_13G008350 [Cocos nucifera]|uniref:Uncharacterized protein n=1 Tax=Cocos nucifera TaxID=13894 RepID=A0A8K0IU67_COCNU|nr:hypothetical protein COCNU_13G008350 [Cocos nucifera]